MSLLGLASLARQATITDSATGNQGTLGGIRRLQNGDVELRIFTPGNGDDRLAA